MRLLQSVEWPRYRGSLPAWGAVGGAALLSWFVGSEAAASPETVQGVSLGLLYAVILAIVLYHRAGRWPGGAWWRQLILAGLLARLVLAFVHLVVGLQFFQGQVDFVGANQAAISFGRAFFTDPLSWLRNAVLDLQIYSYLLGLQYFLVGSSLVGMFLVSAMVGFIGSYLFLRAFQACFPDGGGERFLGATLFFLPGVAYWSGLLGKDSWVFLGLGWTSYAFARLLKGFCPRHALGLAAGLWIATVIRPPVGAAVALALGCAWYVNWRPRGAVAILKPVGVGLAAVGVAGVVIGVSAYYLGGYSDILDPYSVQSVLEIALVKHVGLATDPTAGGSSLSVAVTAPTFGEMIRYLPEGMFTFLFRPLVFEARHVVALAAALDGTVLLALVVWRRRSLVAAIRSMFARPFILCCVLAFVLLTAMLGFSRNLGVIVRHRTMVLPFLMILLAVPLPDRTRHGGQGHGKPL